MRDHKNVFVRFAIKCNQAASNSATRISSLVEKVILLLYHFQELAVLLASSTMSFIPQAKLYGALGHVLRVFQVGFWTEITPITYTDFVVIFFAMMILEIAMISIFLYFVWRKKPLPALMDILMTYQILIVNRYLIYIPLYQSSYYVIFNEKSDTVFYVLSIFNLTMMTILKVFFAIIWYRPAYSTAKFLAQYRSKELNEMIGLLTILGIRMSNYDTPSMTPTYFWFAMACTHLITSFFHPSYLVSGLNRLDLICHSFTFGFTLVLILQATAYNGSKMEFPFLLVSSFLYWLLTNIDGYRKEKMFRLLNQKKTYSTLAMKILPFIYEEFKQVDIANGKLIEAIQPLLAQRIDIDNKDKEIFSSEEYSLESVPLKHKANKAFIDFILKSYEDYFKSPNVYRSGVQPIILAYLFFVRIMLQDNLKVLFLIHDFRRKLKAKRFSFGWILGIQIARLEEICSREYFSLKSEHAIDTSRVFKLMKRSDELILKMSSWAHSKTAFLEELQAQTVNLQVIKDKGRELVKDSKTILGYVRQQTDILKFSKTKNALKFFAEEIMQDQEFLTFDLKTISNMAYNTSKLNFESLDTLKIIERLQNNQKNPILMFSTEGYAGASGKITHNTEYLIQKLGYTQSEVNNLHWTDILVAIDENQRSAKNQDDPSNIIRDHNNNIRRTVHQAILRNHTEGFVLIKSTLHLDIIDDVPSIVLLGQEETSYHQNFLLCRLDGTIEGPSKIFAEKLPESTKFKGRKIQEILSLSYSPDSSQADQDGSKPLKGKLVMNNVGSSNSASVNAKKINFFITRFDNPTPSKEGYYLINIYEKYISVLFEKRNLAKINQTRLIVSQLEIKTEVLQLQHRKSLKTINFASTDNLIIKKDELEFRSTDMLIAPAEESSYLNKKEPKLRKLTTIIDFHNPFSSQDTNTPEKSGVSSRGMVLNSQEPNSGTQKKIISIENFEEEECITSLSHRSRISQDPDDNDEEQLERKRKNHDFIKNQRESSIGSGSSVNGGTKQKRTLERIKRKLKNPSAPLEILCMKILQLAICIGLSIYLIVEYVDLSGRYTILSKLSGLTSFPLILLRNIYGFFQVQELVTTALHDLWLPETRFTHLFLLPQGVTITAYEEFNAEYHANVLQGNPQTYYPDFRYEDYTVDLSLPDTPYLNRAVDFYEALSVLRGYLYKLYEAVIDGSLTHGGAFNFLRQQSLHYDKMLWALSEDLFNRINERFDQLLGSLQARSLGGGGAVALIVGISLLYTFLKLYRYSDRLLSKLVTISGSELIDEIYQLEKKAAIIHGLRDGSIEKKNPWVAAKKAHFKDSQKKHSFSKKYIPLKNEILSRLVIILLLVGLYLIPAIFGYFMKADPVSNCIPLLHQYKIIAANAQNSVGVSSQVMEIVASAATGDPNHASYFLDETQPLLEKAQNQSAELSNFITNQEALVENNYVSSNLTNAVASLRNGSFCEILLPLVMDDICKSTTNGLAYLGVASLKQKTFEWAKNFRSQLKDSNFDATVAANLTFDQTLPDLTAFGEVMSTSLGNLTDIYVENFKEIAKTGNSILQISLIMNLVVYVLLLAIVILIIIQVEKQYNEIKEIYTLIPSRSLLMNPYIKNVLKEKNRW